MVNLSHARPRGPRPELRAISIARHINYVHFEYNLFGVRIHAVR